MLPPDHITCHETGHKKKCKDLCMQCWKWIQIQGSNPNTGQEINEYRCADNWQVFLAMEHSLYERQTGAAVESFRNEMVTQNNQLLTNISNKALKDASSNH